MRLLDWISFLKTGQFGLIYVVESSQGRRGITGWRLAVDASSLWSHTEVAGCLRRAQALPPLILSVEDARFLNSLEFGN